jgi:hypothetical protein
MALVWLQVISTSSGEVRGFEMRSADCKLSRRIVDRIKYWPLLTAARTNINT